MKKTIILILSLLMIGGVFGVSASAMETTPVEESRIGYATFDIDASAITSMPVTRVLGSSRKSVAANEFANSTGTGTIFSIGQFVDFSTLPANATIRSITLYTPTSVRVTQSPFTAILNWHVTAPSGGNPAVISFVRTNSPGTQSRSTVLANQPARGRYRVQIEGRIASNQSGYDGFTVFAGSQMIVEYDF